MAQNTIKVSLLADAQRFKAGLKDAEQALDKTGRKTESTGQKLSTFGKLAVAGLVAGAGAAIASFAKDSIRAFSDLEQSIGGTEAVFGDSSDAIDAFAEKSATAIGLSEAEFRTATTSIGGQLKRMTGDVDFAAEHSIKLTETAADLAATYGGTTQEAVQALGAAFRGEADPAERFNLNLKAGVVTAKALSMGLGDANGKVSEAARAQAILALVTEQSADAMGQFGEEADTVAGQTAILNARLEDQKAAVGEKLAGAWTDLQLVLLDVLDTAAETEAGFSNLAAVSPEMEGNDLLEWAAAIHRGLVDIGIVEEEVISQTALLSSGMDKARHSADRHKQATAELEGETEDLAGATRDSVAALQELQNELRAQADPLFAYAEAIRDQEEAQLKANEAAEEFGVGSPEHIAALDGVRVAAYDVRDATNAMATGTGTNAEAMKTHLRSLGVYTEEQINLIIADMERINAFTFVPKSVTITRRITGGGFQETDKMHSGGVVPGIGDVPMILQGGETVIPRGGQGGASINITINALDPQSAAKAVVQALQTYNRQNGGIPITTRAP